MKRDSNADMSLFGPWFRVLIESSSFSNEEACSKAIEQAMLLMDAFPPGSEGGYPEDEVNWLMIKLWDMGNHYHK